MDHIEAAGSFKGWEDFEAWMHKLMHINFDSIRIVCKGCHKIISYAERMGISFEEAEIEKRVIAFGKENADMQKFLLDSAGVLQKASNAAQRKDLYRKLLKGGK